MVEWSSTKEPTSFNEKRQSLQQMVWEKLDIHMHRMKWTLTLFMPHPKLTQNGLKVWNYKTHRRKLGEKLCNIVFGNDFLDISLKKPHQQRNQNRQMDIKLTNFCAWKVTINRVTRQLIEWDKIIAYHISDQGSISRIYKGILQLNHRKIKQPNLKMSMKLKNDISPEMTCKWITSIWKYAQHH